MPWELNCGRLTFSWSRSFGTSTLCEEKSDDQELKLPKSWPIDAETSCYCHQLRWLGQLATLCDEQDNGLIDLDRQLLQWVISARERRIKFDLGLNLNRDRHSKSFLINKRLAKTSKKLIKWPQKQQSLRAEVWQKWRHRDSNFAKPSKAWPPVQQHRILRHQLKHGHARKLDAERHFNWLPDKCTAKLLTVLSEHGHRLIGQFKLVDLTSSIDINSETAAYERDHSALLSLSFVKCRHPTKVA